MQLNWAWRTPKHNTDRVIFSGAAVQRKYHQMPRLRTLHRRQGNAFVQSDESSLVLFNNRDDHPKNFSYRLNRERRWELAPAYDLSFNEGPNGEHQMAIHGLGKQITRSALLDLADSAQLNIKWAAGRIDEMLAVAGDVPSHLDTRAIRKLTRRHIATQVAANAELLA